MTISPVLQAIANELTEDQALELIGKIANRHNLVGAGYYAASDAQLMTGQDMSDEEAQLIIDWIRGDGDYNSIICTDANEAAENAFYEGLIYTRGLSDDQLTVTYTPDAFAQSASEHANCDTWIVGMSKSGQRRIIVSNDTDPQNHLNFLWESPNAYFHLAGENTNGLPIDEELHTNFRKHGWEGVTQLLEKRYTNYCGANPIFIKDLSDPTQSSLAVGVTLKSIGQTVPEELESLLFHVRRARGEMYEFLLEEVLPNGKWGEVEWAIAFADIDQHFADPEAAKAMFEEIINDEISGDWVFAEQLQPVK